MTKDPYRYFRIEARELASGLTQGILELEKGPASKELVGRLLRLAHTLKGAARVVKQGEIAEAAHAIEGVLVPHREGGSVLPKERTSELFAFVDAIGARVTAIESRSASAPKPAIPEAGAPSPPPPTRLETVRVEIRDMDALLEGVSEAAVKAGALRRHAVALERVKRTAATPELRASLEHLGRDLLSSIERTERELEAVRDRADRLRLVPASDLWAPLERAVRDAAQSLDRRVEFEASGGESKLDAHVLSALSEALLHVVRNAVAHGIEPEAERVAAGKPPAGKVQLLATRRGHRVTFRCSDDGRGIDVDAIRRVAVRRGAISAAEAESVALERAVALIFQGGVSTARAVTEVSGRGVGLEVVQAAIARLKGEVRVESVPGRGTSFEIDVPVSLSSVPALLVEASGTAASIPLDGVVRTMRLAETEVLRSADGDAILLDGTAVPFVSLAGLLGIASPARARSWSVVVVQAASSRAALGIDRLLGKANVVVRPLPAVIGRVPGIAGASFDGEGNPQVMLDPESLIALARTRRGAVEQRAASRPPLLVIDDSLTTRMLEQSILESAGYEVELATSAEEGLERARSRRFGVFVVDVEMPGMDGYEFVALTRRDPVLRDIPAILVTSRGSVEDRRRGAEAGAHAYIAKGEFDQGRLLKTIAELVG